MVTLKTDDVAAVSCAIFISPKFILNLLRVQFLVPSVQCRSLGHYRHLADTSPFLLRQPGLCLPDIFSELQRMNLVSIAQDFMHLISSRRLARARLSDDLSLPCQPCARLPRDANFGSQAGNAEPHMGVHPDAMIYRSAAARQAGRFSLGRRPPKCRSCGLHGP